MKQLSRARLHNPMDSSLRQAPPSMEFSRQEYWSGLPFPSPGNLPDPGIEPRSPSLQTDVLPSEPPGKQAQIFLLLLLNMATRRQHFVMRHTLAGGSWLTTLISVELLTVVYLFKVYRNLIQLYIDIQRFFAFKGAFSKQVLSVYSVLFSRPFWIIYLIINSVLIC